MLLVLLFDLQDQLTVLSKQNGIFVLKSILEIFTMQDAAELSEELETVFNVYDDIEIFVNISSQRVLDMGHFDVEFDKISV